MSNVAATVDFKPYRAIPQWLCRFLLSAEGGGSYQSISDTIVQLSAGSDSVLIEGVGARGLGLFSARGRACCAR